MRVKKQDERKRIKKAESERTRGMKTTAERVTTAEGDAAQPSCCDLQLSSAPLPNASCSGIWRAVQNL
jgi:hypothetical protein